MLDLARRFGVGLFFTLFMNLNVLSSLAFIPLVCVCVCVCVCVRACVRACVCVCVRVRVGKYYIEVKTLKVLTLGMLLLFCMSIYGTEQCSMKLTRPLRSVSFGLFW